LRSWQRKRGKSTNERSANESDIEEFVTLLGQALDPRKLCKRGDAGENGIGGDYEMSLSV
jgi:hypothetical protein